uniref:Uncharacterized protein n=1 Tax=Arundo donax TaxID=35708 RepID=A0A0A9GQ03_ARUDO
MRRCRSATVAEAGSSTVMRSMPSRLRMRRIMASAGLLLALGFGGGFCGDSGGCCANL